MFIPAKERHKCAVFLEIGTDLRYGSITRIVDVERPDKNGILKVLFVGRLIYWKGLHLGLHALAAARRSNPNIELTVIGKGPEEGRLKALARQLGINEHVQWVGYVTRYSLLQLLPDYDTLLFPSLHDSSGNVLLEAMCVGMPIICFDLGGPGAIVDDTVGIVVQAHDINEREAIDELSKALVRISGDSRCRVELSAGALRKRACLTWRHAVGAVYSEIERRLASPD